MLDRPHFFDLTPDQLTAHLGALGMPVFRARQVLRWVYEKFVADPWQMTNLSRSDRQLLETHLCFVQGEVIRHQRATDGTQKLLIDWAAGDQPGSEPAEAKAGRGITTSGNTGTRGLPILQARRPTTEPGTSATQTECVMIPSISQDSGRARRTACISSQVGCPVGCRFCASGLGGLDGNLTAGQIVQQAWQLAAHDGQRITHIVFMGMGEPLSNFSQVVRAARTLMAGWGPGISGRKITLSTVGLPAQIRRLAEMDLPITLAISLHAPNDTLRRQIIPWAEFVTIQQLTEAGQYYFQKTGREVTLEYILLGGLNDQAEHAQELARVARQLRSNINLIRYNEVAGLPFQRPATEDVHAFQAILKERGINTHIRASRGRDIAAACGQLRHEQTCAS